MKRVAALVVCLVLAHYVDAEVGGGTEPASVLVTANGQLNKVHMTAAINPNGHKLSSISFFATPVDGGTVFSATRKIGAKATSAEDTFAATPGRYFCYAVVAYEGGKTAVSVDVPATVRGDVPPGKTGKLVWKEGKAKGNTVTLKVEYEPKGDWKIPNAPLFTLKMPSGTILTQVGTVVAPLVWSGSFSPLEKGISAANATLDLQDSTGKTVTISSPTKAISVE